MKGFLVAAQGEKVENGVQVPQEAQRSRVL